MRERKCKNKRTRIHKHSIFIWIILLLDSLFCDFFLCFTLPCYPINFPRAGRQRTNCFNNITIFSCFTSFFSCLSSSCLLIHSWFGFNMCAACAVFMLFYIYNILYHSTLACWYLLKIFWIFHPICFFSLFVRAHFPFEILLTIGYYGRTNLFRSQIYVAAFLFSFTRSTFFSHYYRHAFT